MTLPTVFLDIDNTLILADKGLTDRAYQALRNYLDAGGNLVFTTGKLPVSLHELIKRLKLEDSYHMGGNGAIMFNMAKNDYQLLAQVGKRSEKIIKTSLKQGLEPYVYYKDKIVQPFNHINQEESDHFVKIGEPRPEIIDPKDLDFEQVIKVLFYIDIEEEDKEKIVEDAAHGIKDIELIRTGSYLLEVHDIHQTKAHPAHIYCDMYDLDIKKDCIAVGDSENDLPLLQAVGKAYLVSNASDFMKSQGFEIIGSCDDDAVADLLDELRAKPSN